MVSGKLLKLSSVSSNINRVNTTVSSTQFIATEVVLTTSRGWYKSTNIPEKPCLKNNNKKKASTQEAEAGGSLSKLESKLVYKESPKPARGFKVKLSL